MNNNLPEIQLEKVDQKEVTQLASSEITLEQITPKPEIIEVPKIDLQQITAQLMKSGDIEIPVSQIKLTGEEKIITLATPFFLDTFHNAALSIVGACKTLQNLHTHKGMLETREGTYSPNSALYEPSANNKVIALFRFYDKDGGDTEATDKIFFACISAFSSPTYTHSFIYWNGSSWETLTLPTGVPMTATSLYTGDFKQLNNKVYYGDGNSPVMELGFVNGTLKALKAGLPSPDWKRDIDLCETATMGSGVGEWAVTYDPSVDTSNVAITGCGTVTLDDSYMKREEGDYSLQFRARFPTAGTPRPRVLFTKKLPATITLESFENGEVSNGNDYIAFRLYRHVKPLIKGLALQFSVGGTAFAKIWSFPICGDFRVKVQTANVSVDATALTDTTAGVDFTPYTTTPSRINPTLAKFWVRFLDVGNNMIGGAYLGDLHESTDHIIHIFNDPKLRTSGGLFYYGKTAGDVSGYEILHYNDYENVVAEGTQSISEDWVTFSNAVADYNNNPYDHQCFDLRLRKKWALPEGSAPPSDPETEWDGIQAYRLIMIPDKETAGVTLTDPEVTAAVNIDNLRLLKSPPIPVELSVKIADFDGGEEWGTTGVNIEPNIAYQGVGCLRIKAAATATWTFTADKDWTYYGSPYLSKSDPDLAVKGSAYVSFYAAGKGGGSKTITVRFNDVSTNVSHAYAYTYSTNPKENMIAAWNELTAIKGVGFADDLAFDWAAVKSIAITNNTADDIFIDKMRIIPYKGTKVVEDFNSAYYTTTPEDGTPIQYINFVDRRIIANPIGCVEYNTTDSEYMEEMGDNPTTKAIYKWGSILLTAGKGDAVSATIDRGNGLVPASETLIDLTSYETVSGYAAAIEATDEFSCWAKMGETESGDTKASESVSKITFTLYYSATAGTFATDDFWDYTFSAEYLKQAFKKSKQINLTWKVGDMVFRGATPGNNNFAKIVGGKITLEAAKNKKAMVWFDSWEVNKPGALSGTYYTKLKFLNNNQEESASSEASIPVSCDSSDMYVIDMASPTLDTRITAKALYLLGGTSTEWRRAGIYPTSIDNVKVSIKEENFGKIMEDDYYEPPPKVSVICPSNNQMLYGNVTGWDNRKYPSYIYRSRPFMPGQVSKLDFLPIDNEDGQQIMGIEQFYNYTLAFKNHSTYVIDTDSEVMSYGCKSRNYGCIARRSIAVTPYGVIFLSHQGLVLTDVSTFNIDLARPINNTFTDIIKAYGESYLSIAIGFYCDDFYYILYDSGYTGTNNSCLCCYLPDGEKGWKSMRFNKAADTRLDIRSISVWQSETGAYASTPGNQIYAGDADGRVHRLFCPETTPAGYDVYDTNTTLPIVPTLQTFDMDLGNPNTIKQAKAMYHTSAELVATPVTTLTFTPYTDQTAGTPTSAQTLASTSFSRSSKIPLKTGQGALLGLGFTGVNRSKISNISILYIDKGMA